MHAVASAFGVLANFADDIRHLQRTEIGEVGEAFEARAGGLVHHAAQAQSRGTSSTSRACGRCSSPRMLTLYMDQISEHQRDLTNSASGRFAVEIGGRPCRRGRPADPRSMRKLVVDRRADAAELRVHGEERHRRALVHPPCGGRAIPTPTRRCAASPWGRRREKGTYGTWPWPARSSAPYLARLSEDQRRVLEDPRRYTGMAAERARRVCDEWERRLGL